MKINDKIVFKHNNEVVQYLVTKSSVNDKYYLSHNSAGPNEKIFELLEIKDRYEFCKKAIGHCITNKSAWFPEVNSLEDLEKIIDALYQRIIEISIPKFKVGDPVIILERKGCSSDYPMSYIDDMIEYKNQFCNIEKVRRLSINQIKDCIKKPNYEEPFYYELTSNGYLWNSAMLNKVEVVNIDGVHSCIATHTSAVTCDKAIDDLSLYPEKSEESDTRYKLTFKSNYLKF